MEAEFRSMSFVSSKIIWLWGVLKELNIFLLALTPLYANNKNAIRLLANLEFHEQMKYIVVDYHFICEHYEAETITVSHISSQNLFTKAMSCDLHNSLMSKSMLIDDHINFKGSVKRVSILVLPTEHDTSNRLSPSR